LPYSLVLLAGATLSAQAPTPADWPVYGGGPESMRYSALQQITRQNVTHLKVAWTFDASDGIPSSELEVNPIVVNGVLYATAGRPPARREADGLARDARDRLQEPAHHRQPDGGEPPDAAGRRAGVRRENRGVALDLPHDSPARRVRVRNLAERRVDVFRRRQ